MTTIPKLEIGHRVLVVPVGIDVTKGIDPIPDSTEGFLGIVIDLPVAGKASIKLDKEKAPTEVNVRRCLPVIMWKSRKLATNVRKVILDENASVLETFTRKYPAAIEGPAVMGMWYYLNNKVFKNQLREPVEIVVYPGKIKIPEMRKQVRDINGLWSSRGKGRSWIGLSNKLKTPVAIFQTLAHEMCHQAHWEIDVSKKGQPMAEGKGHGKEFVLWADRCMKYIPSLRVGTFTQSSDLEVKDDNNPDKVSGEETGIIEPFLVVVIYYPNSGRAGAAKVRDFEDARRLIAEVSKGFRSMKVGGHKFKPKRPLLFSVTCRDKILNSLIKTTTPKKAEFSVIPLSAYTQLKRTHETENKNTKPEVELDMPDF